MSNRSTIDNRRYYRLQYPMAERPIVRANEREYLVAEISEKGAKILIRGESVLEVGEPLSGEIQFKDHETLSIEGVVLRRDGNYMAVQLSQGISPQRMLVEQIHLRKKYPMRFDPMKSDEDSA